MARERADREVERLPGNADPPALRIGDRGPGRTDARPDLVDPEARHRVRRAVGIHERARVVAGERPVREVEEAVEHQLAAVREAAREPVPAQRRAHLPEPAPLVIEPARAAHRNGAPGDRERADHGHARRRVVRRRPTDGLLDHAAAALQDVRLLRHEHHVQTVALAACADRERAVRGALAEAQTRRANGEGERAGLARPEPGPLGRMHDAIGAEVDDVRARDQSERLRPDREEHRVAMAVAVADDARRVPPLDVRGRVRAVIGGKGDAAAERGEQCEDQRAHRVEGYSTRARDLPRQALA